MTDGRLLLSGERRVSPFLQLIELAGAIDGSVGRCYLNIPATVRYQLPGFLQCSGDGLPVESDASRGILRSNQKPHMIGSRRHVSSILD